MGRTNFTDHFYPISNFYKTKGNFAFLLDHLQLCFNLPIPFFVNIIIINRRSCVGREVFNPLFLHLSESGREYKDR